MSPAQGHGHELKLARSLHHLQDLKSVCGRYIAQTEQNVVHERDPQVPTQVLTWVTAYPPPRDPFSLLVGDCLQCLRTALDQLAFELATAFTVPLRDEIAKVSEFPIFGDEDGQGAQRFNRLRSKGAKAGLAAPGSGLAKTEGMDPSAQRIIEAMQPYHRGQAYDSDPLWRIHELNRIDKHRLLHSTGAFQASTQIRVPSVLSRAITTDGFLPTGTITSKGGEIHGRTEVGTWPWPAAVPIPSGGADVGFGPAIQVVFEKSVPLVGGEDVVVVFGDLYNYVVTDVLPPLGGFLK